MAAGSRHFSQREVRTLRRSFRGDGGKGGDVIVKADASINTLRAYKHRRIFKAEDGQPGMTKK